MSLTAQMDDSYFMALALKLAIKAGEAGEVPVGAIVVLHGEIIGRGYNTPISSNDPTAHAEVNAIRNAGKNQSNYRLKGATLYVTLEPCVMCAAALSQARIARLVFGAADPKRGAAGSTYDIPSDERSNHHFDVSGGVLSEECSSVLKQFFVIRR